ncbi:Domain of unknown function (DUF814) [Seminavis robusta]|uniref:NFACT protein RNA binding domain-containing protein n=1 Tax=Seminavis robusta TaxID=568900 RepID=A0A9N8HNJ8_9STRA|nr:Domain of unknown function (DUF814) [Seminavis robusta]|eukprot:Sro992_g228830.1 Domain of unknown function (DUF814) (499) ;mRNA; f:22895-24391
MTNSPRSTHVAALLLLMPLLATGFQLRTLPRLSAVGIPNMAVQPFRGKPIFTPRCGKLFSTTSPKDTDTDIPVESTNRGTWEEEHDDDEEEEELSQEESDDEIDANEDDDDNSPLLQEYEHWMKAISKAQTGLSKKQTSLEHERSKAQALEDTVSRAQLIVNNLYLFNNNNNNNNNNKDDNVYYVVDWEKDGIEVELKLDPQYESASAEADALFAQARKLKRGSKVVEELLEQVKQALQLLMDCQADLESAKQPQQAMDEGRVRLVQDRLRRTSSTTQFQEPQTQSRDVTTNNSRNNNQNSNSRHNNNNKKNKKPALGTPASHVRKLLTPNGATVLVGRNRRGNEYLTFTQARGNDIWMHARGTPGAHILVLDRRGSVRPTDACMEFAAHLAAFYSDGRAEAKVPVTVAAPKHLLKPRGAPLGAVKLRQEGQVLYGCPELVPPELVQARAQSGQSEEYRSADKAKHRKQTRQRQQRKRTGSSNNKRRNKQQQQQEEDG